MNCTFDISQLEILSILTFDASVNYSDIQPTPINGQIEFEIERRSFESVRRSKFLFWDRTEYQGKKSKLVISGIKSISIEGGDKLFKDNHFIDQFEINKETGNLEMKTSFGLLVIFDISASFKVILSDIQNSEFGSGKSFGKHGFTNMEWKEYLIKMNYAT